jgi:uncharacterized membrane protein
VGAYLEPGAEPNADGTIPAGTVHGFVWERGRFASFDVPGSIFTQAFGINDRAQITGGYYDATGTQHAFLQDEGRRYQILDAPGGSIAYGINDRGEIILPDPRAAGCCPSRPDPGFVASLPTASWASPGTPSMTDTRSRSPSADRDGGCSTRTCHGIPPPQTHPSPRWRC